MHPEIEQEVVDLITIISTGSSSKLKRKESMATQRLFEIFIQTEDMTKYTSDFNEIAAILGNPDTNDPFDWSQFDLQTDKDLKRLSAEMQALEQPQREKQREEAKRMNMLKQRENDDDEEGEYDEDNNDYSDEEDNEEEEEKEDDEENRVEMNDKEKNLDQDLNNKDDDEVEKKFDVFSSSDSGSRRNRSSTTGDRSADEFITSQMNTDEKLNLNFNKRFELEDEDGNIWSACLLDTDMVQKVTPGQRVNTYRALAVIGNGKGAAGFGMGKGKNGSEALYSACR